MVELRKISVNAADVVGPRARASLFVARSNIGIHGINHISNRSQAQSRDATHMSEQNTLLSRIGSWFSRKSPDEGGRANGDLPLHGDVTSHSAGGGGSNLLEPRSSFLRPWARRDQA